jgi:two-component system OmpR family response regulator
MRDVRSQAPTDTPVARAPEVLVVDDDPEVAAMLSRYLRGQGLGVRVASDGVAFRAQMRAPTFDVVLLDLGLPDEDGLALMRDLRARWQGPVIIVSGRGDSIERTVGLELGADDYVSKPFDLRELLARIRSVLRRADPRRAAQVPAPVLRFDGLQLDPDARSLSGRDGAPIPLTTGELDLLLALLERPQRVLSRDRLMTHLHGREAGPFDRAVDMQVARLRRKIERDPANPVLVQAVRGAGYVFTGTVERG